MAEFLVNRPELVREWDYEKNAYDPTAVTCGSSKKIWWKCSKGHSWKAMVKNRAKGTGCPVCANLLILPGVNDLFTTCPELEKYWDATKNNRDGLDCLKLSASSSKKVWWVCENGHSYLQSVYSKVKGVGCPVCSNHLIIPGINDLFTTNPELAEEWVYEKNADIGLFPEKLSKGKEAKAWWKCRKCGHEWSAMIYSRIAGNDCPNCGKNKAKETLSKTLVSVKGSLADTAPVLMEEWNYEKNGDLTPHHVTSGSSKKVWWICRKGHEWQATVSSRSRGNGCPECAKEQFTSFPEQAILYYLKRVFPEVINRYKLNGKTELDIFVPEIRFAIEYDGYRYHERKRDKDQKKTELAQNEGIYLVHIVECIGNMEDQDDQNNIYCKYNIDYAYLNGVIAKITALISAHYEKKISIDIDIERDRILILEQYIQTEKENSIIVKSPQLSTEWDYGKNGKIKPEFVNYGSRRKYWWICKKGHSYQSSPANRVHGFGCPYCAGKKVIIGETDLASKYPVIAAEWDVEKNGTLTPEMISAKSDKIVWWKCQTCGYSFRSTPNNRVKGTGCTVCKNQIIIAGYNDLATTNPELCAEWDLDKNSINPTEVSVGSNQKIWWRCQKCDSTWEASVSDRKRGKGCPFCANKKIRAGLNDLATTNPELLIEWDYSENEKEGIYPTDYSARSGKKANWKCQVCSHTWKSRICDKSAKKGCPNCAKEKQKQSKSKAVGQYSLNDELIQVYSSATEAFNKTGIYNIATTCRGEQKTAGGYIWRYILL